ncbi:glycosyltransferase [candidate division KSB1 bacterium]|nr:MAG: glycosyltransferase [candidate division KSB1 bacterium]
MMRILFLSQTTAVGAASRMRIYAYLSLLKHDSFAYDLVPGTTESQDIAFLQSPTLLIKIRWFLSKVLHRLLCLARIRSYDCVVLQRETLPYFFPFTEILLSTFARKFVFDFDDAIFVYPKKKTVLKKLFMDRKHVIRILRRCDRVIVSTNYLREFCVNYVKDVRVIPTCVTLSEFSEMKKVKGEGKLIIGWIGSYSTRGYLLLVENILRKLALEYNFQFIVIGAGEVRFDGIDMLCKKWHKESEVDDLLSFDIGIMPLPDNPWTRGKAGYKLIQYMAAGVPAVASAVGVNVEIIQDGISGYLASDEEEWLSKLGHLLADSSLRQRFAEQGWHIVEQRYSTAGNLDAWVQAVSKFDGCNQCRK